MIFATCAALAMLLADPAGGKHIALTEDCHGPANAPAVVFAHNYRAGIIIEAGAHRVAGVQIMKASNVVWRGGTIVAPCQGSSCANGPPQYGARVVDASNVVFEGVTFTDARKAVVLDRAVNVTLRFTRCQGAVEDCVIASASQQLTYTNNQAGPFTFVPTSCTLPNGTVRTGLSQRDCIAILGKWRDGWHPDVFQMRNGVRRVLIALNIVRSSGQVFTQMDTTGDAPLAMVDVLANDIEAGRHGLTLGACDGCTIKRNTLRSYRPDWRAVIIPGRAAACGNSVPSGGPGRDPCPHPAN
jgi:hypothetical protein